MFTYMQSFSFNIRVIKNRMSYYSTACAWDTVRMQSWYRTHYNKLRSFLFGKSKRLWATALVSPSELKDQLHPNGLPIGFYWSIGMLQCCTGPSSNLPEMRPIQPFNCQEYNRSVQVLYCIVLFSFYRCQMTAMDGVCGGLQISPTIPIEQRLRHCA